MTYIDLIKQLNIPSAINPPPPNIYTFTLFEKNKEKAEFVSMEAKNAVY